jgi:hypothetical protein
MAVVWIVTTGNSDVKLSSDYQWCRLREQKREQLKPCYNDFNSPVKDANGLFLLPARVMGLVYGDALDTHWRYFLFPILTEFTQKIKADKKNVPDRIIVLLTNQEEIFPARNSVGPLYDRADSDCPLWKDTGKLEPILQRFFDENFGAGKAKFYPLKPKTIQEGLDNWDSTLRLVQEEFEQWEILKEDRVIVSHQASTPAISSAVQFTSLAKFGEKVDFLITNERDLTLTKFLHGSKYLKEIRKKEAEALLDRHDYSGVEALIIDYPKDKDTETLLNAAIQWNFAKFDEFANEVEKLSSQEFQDLVQGVKARRHHWWWEAYEAAYLGSVRLFKQGNTVEAMFHSFRAVEGLLYKWVVTYHSDKLEDRNNGGKDIVVSRDENEKPKKTYNAYGKGLYLFLDFCRTVRKNNDKDIWIFGNCVFDRRNELFHQLEGLQDKKAVFTEWQSSEEKDKRETFDEQCWKARVINCLNFIAKDDLPKKFASPEEASLMVQVHEKLVKAIAQL